MRFAQIASTAAGFKAHKRLSASFGKRAMPATDRIVSQQKHLGDLLAAQAIVKQHESVGAARQSMRNRAIARQPNQRGAFVSR